VNKVRTYMFVGGCNRPAPYFASSNSKGIAVFTFDEKTARTELLGVTEGIDNPTFLVIDSHRRKLYANSEVMAWNEGTVSAYDIDPASGILSYINKQPTLGNAAAQMSLDRSGRFLLVANYGLNATTERPNRSVAVLPIRGDGGLDPATASATHSGETGPQADRQDRPHAHAALASPNNRFIVASDLGLDQLVIYRFDAATGGIVRVGETALAPGSGPRHFVFHPSGGMAFLVNELNSTAVSLSFDEESGRMAVLATAPTAPPETLAHNRCSEIQLSPNGKFLCVANRGNDDLAIFRLGVTGAIMRVSTIPSGGKTPRHFAFDPSGRFMAVANQDSDRVSVFSVDPGGGELSPTDRDISIGTPTSIDFCRL
jgi:6-phosphogluconolactonase